MGYIDSVSSAEQKSHSLVWSERGRAQRNMLAAYQIEEITVDALEGVNLQYGHCPLSCVSVQTTPAPFLKLPRPAEAVLCQTAVGEIGGGHYMQSTSPPSTRSAAPVVADACIEHT